MLDPPTIWAMDAAAEKGEAPPEVITKWERVVTWEREHVRNKYIAKRRHSEKPLIGPWESLGVVAAFLCAFAISTTLALLLAVPVAVAVLIVAVMDTKARNKLARLIGTEQGLCDVCGHDNSGRPGAFGSGVLGPAKCAECGAKWPLLLLDR